MVFVDGLKGFFEVLHEASSINREGNHAVAMLELLTVTLPLNLEIAGLVALAFVLPVAEMISPTTALELLAITLLSLSLGGSLAKKAFPTNV